MAQEREEKPNVALNTRPRGWALLALRLVAFLATTAATLVMALNKESKSLVVATIGTTPIKATLTAKFQHTPAFIFFVIANGMASIHNLLMMGVQVFGHKYGNQGLLLSIVAILDMLTVALVSAGTNAAAFMAELGKNGNKHARWGKICDKFETYCDHGAGALVASFIALILLLAISAISILKLHKLKPSVNVIVP